MALWTKLQTLDNAEAGTALKWGSLILACSFLFGGCVGRGTSGWFSSNYDSEKAKDLAAQKTTLEAKITSLQDEVKVIDATAKAEAQKTETANRNTFNEKEARLAANSKAADKLKDFERRLDEKMQTWSEERKALNTKLEGVTKTLRETEEQLRKCKEASKKTI